MENIEIGSRVYLGGLRTETGVVVECDERNRRYKVQLDADETIVEAGILDLTLCD